MRKVYFITQYFDIIGSKDLGGVLIRKKQIELFQLNGYKVEIVMPSKFHSQITVENNVTYIPYFHQKQIADLLERLQIWPDLGYIFSLNAFNFLKDKIKKDDILFCITGGSLECIILGSLLKKQINCKFVINYQDPINHTKVNGYYVDGSIRFKRNKAEEKYIKNADLIITSSSCNRKNLLRKYIFLSENNVINCYYGYIKNKEILHKDFSNKNTLVSMYSGIYGVHQKPENIAEIISKNINIDLFLVGNTSKYKPLENIHSKNIKTLGFMPHNEFLNWVNLNVDIGIVSLTSEYLGACVPSKIYEYINLNLPIIGLLPNGDAKDIVNNNGFGKVFEYNDIKGLEDFILNELNTEFILECKQNLKLQKDNWSMENRFKDILLKLNSLI